MSNGAARAHRGRTSRMRKTLPVASVTAIWNRSNIPPPPGAQRRDAECSLTFRGLLSARSIESGGRADERLERIRVNLLTLVNVDGAPDVPVKARVEELGRIFQGSALKEGQLHYRFVRLSRADASVVGPYRCPHPLPLFHDIRVGLPDEGAHPCQCFASPVTKLGDLLADQFGGRLACCLWLTLHRSSPQ